MSTVEISSTSNIAGKYLTFSLSKERYGLEILKVQEIIRVTHITSVPKSPECIKGVINLRGKIIPVMDLRLRFSMPPSPYDEKTCIIVVNVGSGERRFSMGIIVDTVLEVMNFTDTEVEPAPDYGTQFNSRFIIGMAKRDQNLHILVDIERVLTENLLSQAEQLAQ